MRTHIAAAVLVVAGLGAVSAQESVTLMLTSGQRVPAQLMDLGGAGFTVQVGNEQRNISKNDIAVIDFGGGAMQAPAEVKDLGAGHLFVMRNGSLIRGELVDIGGSRPLRLTVRTDSGNRDLSSADVRRIYLGRPAAAGNQAVAAAAPPAGGVSVQVQGNQKWTATNIVVRRGQQVRFEANGQIRLAAGGDPVGPDGGSNRDPGATIPGVATGTLIGRVDPGRAPIKAEPFVIGTAGTVTIPYDGRLQFGVNDSVVTDNSGNFTVIVNANSTR